MLSDEEKKAIKRCTDLTRPEHFSWIGISNQQAIITVLNLIEKQSKEIEELKEENKKKSIVIIEYQDLYEKLKDKIKAKIEELEKGNKNTFIRGEKILVLQSLLEKE